MTQEEGKKNLITFTVFLRDKFVIFSILKIHIDNCIAS